MHSYNRVAPLTRTAAQPKAATVVSVQAAEPDLQAAGIALCLAARLSELRQRVLLLDLDTGNNIALYCGLEHVVAADQACITATSSIAADRPFAADSRFNFGELAIIPAGWKSCAAMDTLRTLCSYSTKQSSPCAASLQELRQEYDFVLIDAPPMMMRSHLANPLSDFSAQSADVVLLPHLTLGAFGERQIHKCAQFIHAAQRAAARPTRREVWVMPLDYPRVDAALLQHLENQFRPDAVHQITALQYSALAYQLAILQSPGFETGERIVHIRRLAAEFLDSMAQTCLALRE